MRTFNLLGLGIAALLMGTVACGTATDDGSEGSDSDLNGVRGSLDVTTRNYDNLRTGANTSETTFTIDNVRASANKFHKVFSIPVDEKIETFPLYKAGSPKNFLYVTTMNNSVYAFNADTGEQIWHRSLGTAVSGPAFTKVKPTTVNGKFGIAATPVIDNDTGTMYVARWAFEGGGPVYRLFVLNLSDGNDQQPSVKLDATVNVGGHTASFDHTGQIVRASLLLVRKKRGDGGVDKAVIVTAAGGESPTSPHGWVLAYDVAELQNQGGGVKPAAFCTTPKSGAGGIWMAGGGPAADEKGNIWFATGNGRYDGQSDFGESFVKLTWSPGSLDLADSFTPFQDVNRDNKHQDQDLGSASPLLIPGTNIVAGGGKDGILYVMNRDEMGREDFSKLVQPPFVASYVPTPGSDPVRNLDIISSHDPPTQSPVDGGRIHHIHSTPVFWNSPNEGSLLYVWGENALLRAIQFDGNRFGTSPVAKGNVTPSKSTPGIGGMPGGMITLSSNGNKANTGIVWALHAIDGDANKQVVKGILRAYDASNFKTAADGSKVFDELWNSEMNPADSMGNGAKVVPPMVASGHVYAPTYDNKINVYGLR
jgi:outer membrane protein assembly factor BamB